MTPRRELIDKRQKLLERVQSTKRSLYGWDKDLQLPPGTPKDTEAWFQELAKALQETEKLVERDLDEAIG